MDGDIKMKVKIILSESELNALERYVDFLVSYKKPCIGCSTYSCTYSCGGIGCAEIAEWNKMHSQSYNPVKYIYTNPCMKKYIEAYREVIEAERVKLDAENKYEILKNLYNNMVSDEITVISDSEGDKLNGSKNNCN